jgi:hypothetical protein
MARRQNRLQITKVVPATARAWVRHAPLLLPLALLVFTPLGALDAADEHFGEVHLEHLDLFAALTLGRWAAELAVSSLGDDFYAGVAAAAVSETRAGERRPTILQIARTVPYLRLIAADLLFTFGFAFTLVLLVVPGVIFFAWFSLTTVLIKVEHLGVWAGFCRSRELVRGNFWPVLLLVGSLYIGDSVVTSALQSGALAAIGDSFWSDWASAVAVGVVITPIGALATVLVTYELKDIEQRIPADGQTLTAGS